MSMEEIVDELRKAVRFKKTTEVGDLVLVVMENPRAAFYALVTGIERDASKKDEWWHLTMQLLTVPPRKTAWTLRTEQFTGREIFSMGGEKRFIQAVFFEEKETDGPADGRKAKSGAPGTSKLRLVK